MNLLKWIPVLVIAMVLLGCSFTVNVPTATTGPVETFTVNEPYPSGVTDPLVNIDMGAGTLNVSGGAEGLISGEISYNIHDWLPVVNTTSNGLTLEQKSTQTIRIPSGRVINDWYLKLGNKPLGLDISAGAYSGTIDLSGVPVTSLSINDGASKSTVVFDTPNPVAMQELVYKTGASQVTIRGIANANVSEVSFDGGAGAYELDFGGTLKNDISCSVKTGMSDVKLVIPQGTHARITITGGLGNVNTSGTWIVNGSTYEVGSGSPMIEIQVEMAVGNLTLSQK